jgi:excisionase family DNA binding protein
MIQRPTTIPQFRRWLIERLHILSHVEGAGKEPPIDVVEVLMECRKFALRLALPDVAALVNGNRTLPYATQTLSRCLGMVDRLTVEQAPKPNGLLTVAEAAEQFNFSTRTIYRLIEDGLPHVKARGAIRIKPHDLEAYLNVQQDQSWERSFD